MKRNLLIIGFLWISSAMAQPMNHDSLAYEQQRQKVNALLEQRTTRFGHYEESLQKRTGIFGLKTKRDMQKSIDILKNIVLTDNEVFKETKKLLNYKDQVLDYKEFENSQIQKLAANYDERINGYIQTISKLHQEQERLQTQIQTLQQKSVRLTSISLLLLFIFLGIGAYLWYKKQKLTQK